MAVFHVSDMNCGHCAKRITEALERAGYTGFTVDLASKTVTVDAPADAVVALLDDAGYTASVK
ncbi:MAG: heavy-metal-associated domain-containing protein [Pyramidobacter sp.]|nr:heavy-metal-associated domain-containing protein [Pyramidobacter sp.]